MTKIKLGKFYKHEALDRTALIIDAIYMNLEEHPYVKANKKVKKNIVKAMKFLSNAYQLIGSDEK